MDSLQEFYSTHKGVLHGQYAKFSILRQECKELKEKLDGYGSKNGIEREIHNIENQIRALRENMSDKATTGSSLVSYGAEKKRKGD